MIEDLGSNPRQAEGKMSLLILGSMLGPEVFSCR